VTLSRWWPPVAWAVCILVATWIPGATLPRVNAPPGTDKVVHFLFFAVLGYLTLASMRGRGNVRAVLVVLIVIAMFGAMDEYVQQFIPGRSMELFDWLADLAGASVGLMLSARAGRTAREREAHS
jgi:VanZ family protein